MPARAGQGTALRAAPCLVRTPPSLIGHGRKNWLFIGSDDHADAAAHLLACIASARLHTLDAEVYLREVLRVLPHWPKSRYLELSPKYWAATRARLDAEQLAAEFGPLTVPPAPEQEPATD